MLSLKLIQTLDGHEVALWCMSSDNNTNEPAKNVLMIHGTFSDKRIFLGLSKYLVKAGYKVWILEWRSHGSSQKADSCFTFETIANQEIKAAFDYLLNDCFVKKPRLHNT